MRKNGFFAMVSRMKHIYRWGLMRNSLRENLCEHSFEVAVTAHALALIGREYFGRDVDAGQAAAVALFHDTPEILTGDTPTPVKHGTPDLREALKSIEASATRSLLSTLPPELRPHYKVLFSFEAENPEIYALVKAADKISAYIKCVEELKSGNGEFLLAAVQTRRAIADMHLPEADYYMEHFAPSFELSLDELQSGGEQGKE